MIYTATVRRKNGPAATMKEFRAFDIKQGAEIVRAKFDLYTDDPHEGFAIKEYHPSPRVEKKRGR